MELRRAGPDDIENLAALGAATFTDTFGHLYVPEDLQHFIDTTHSKAAYADAVNSEDQPVWVIEQAGILGAFIKLCPNGLPCDPPRPDAIELSKLYASAEIRNQGIGARLLGAACNWAVDNGYSEMVLSVFSENYGGQRFYARHGFEKIGDYLFPVGQQLDQEWIMLKRLKQP